MRKYLSSALAGIALAAGTCALGQRTSIEDSFSPPSVSKTEPRYAAASRHVQARLIVSHGQVVRGQTFYAALELQIEPGWVYYSPDPGAAAGYEPMGARVRVDGGSFRSGEALFGPDHPHQTDLGEVKVTNNVYEGRTLIFVPLTVPADAELSEQMIELVAEGQICSASALQCLDMRLGAAAAVNVGAASIAGPQWDEDLAAALGRARSVDELRDSHRPVAATVAGADESDRIGAMGGLGLALLAGLILNIMPCVLPVIPLRVLSIVAMAGQSRRRFVTLGLAFSGGIVLFFVALAAVNVVLRLVTAEALSWGRHFQNPAFMIGMSMLLVALAANLFGLFNVTVPRRVAQLGSAAPEGGGGHLSSISMGVMMAILATPCSFVILLSALAWAQVQATWLGTLGVIFIGVGMALPHAVLTAFPALVSRLPRPGRWTESFKQSMGFVLLLVAIWLISTIKAQPLKSPSPFWVTAFAVVLTMCLWMWGTWVRYDTPLRRKIVVRAIAAALAVAAGFWMLRPPPVPAIAFVDFDETRIAKAREEGRVVLVKFTSDWCLSCAVLDRTVFNRPDVAEELRRRNVLAVKGDVTRPDQPANRMLYEQFRGAPPLTVIFPPGRGRGIVLKGKYSKSSLLEALDEAAGGKSPGGPSP